MDCYNGYPLCLECGENERNKPHPWCEGCYQQHRGRPAPHIVMVPEKEYTDSTVLQRIGEYTDSYKDVHKLFVDRWDRRKSPCPEIAAAYSINNKMLQSRYDEYKKKLRQNGKDPNEEIHFHGTVLDCDLLSDQVECGNTKCGICGIAQSGFDKKMIGYNIRFQRFGHGIYLAPNSSKCHDYTQGSYTVRAMLVCKVALGKPCPLTQNDPTLKAAPPGYDSVHGMNSPQGVLNYDEVVVYRSRPILPTHVIVYERDGIGKIAK